MKKVVIYGNCHTVVIKEVLNRTPEFCAKYQLLDVPAIQNITSVEDFLNPAFHEADVFIHQDIRLDNQYGKEWSSEFRIKEFGGVQTIAIPNVYRMPTCFFPQYEEEYGVQHEIFWKDVALDKMYAEGMSRQLIKDLYLSDDLYSKEYINELFELFIRKVKTREKKWDIPVSEFILNTYKLHQLFFDPNHPTSYFLKYIAKEIMKILEVDYQEISIDNMLVSELTAREMPILPCVKRALGMEFPQEEMRHYSLTLSAVPMTYRRYIDEYLSLEWQNKEIPETLQRRSFIKYVCLMIFYPTNRLVKTYRRFYRKLLKKRQDKKCLGELADA